MKETEGFEAPLEVPLKVKSWYLAKSASLGIRYTDLIKMALGTFMWQNAKSFIPSSRSSENNRDLAQADTSSPGNGLASSAKLENSLEIQLSRMEKQVIEKAILQTAGNKNEAAKLLGISPRTMRYKIKKHGL